MLGSQLPLRALFQLILVVGTIPLLVGVGDGARFLAGCQLEVRLSSQRPPGHGASRSVSVYFSQASRILSFSPCEFQEGPHPY